MTDELMPPADNQPLTDSERPPGFALDGEPAVYAIPDETGTSYTGGEATPAVTVADNLSLRERLRRLSGSGDMARRRDDLTQMIVEQPEAASNYILRGELLLEAGDYGAATEDFRRGLELAAQQVETADWGLVAQALQDRALAGLERAERRMKRVESSDVGAGL